MNKNALWLSYVKNYSATNSGVELNSSSSNKDIISNIDAPSFQEFDPKAESLANHLTDPEFNEEPYLADFELFSKNQKYMEDFKDLFYLNDKCKFFLLTF